MSRPDGDRPRAIRSIVLRQFERTAVSGAHYETRLELSMGRGGHKYNHANWSFCEADYAGAPPHPCSDAELGYEVMPDARTHVDGGYLDDDAVLTSL